MILAKAGKSEYRIVRGEGKTLIKAAEELAKYLELISDAALEIGPDADSVPKILLEISPEGLKNDGYRVHTEGDDLIITGENERGILYGVYGFLENQLGCRFFAPGVEKIPKLATLELPALNETVIPPFEYRESSWRDLQQDSEFRMKRGCNGQIDGEQKEEFGEAVRYLGWAHTLFNYVSPDEYFDEHPEYFSEVNGQRLRKDTQLCLTNPEVLAITKRKLRENILAHPEFKIVSLTQMDCYNPCTCPECARVDAEEGSHAGTMLRFVNACAASIADEFPDVTIDTFAYEYTRHPPKITRPLPNVCVRICSIECCRNHPIAECGEVAYPFKKSKGSVHTFQDDLSDWSKICKRMFVWDYTTDFRFYLSPFPNFHTLAPNIRFFLKNGATGLFEQGNSQAKSAEFGELRAYMLSRLMWNPNADDDQLIQEFLEGYYGKAAAPIRKYIRLLEEDVSRQASHIGIYEDPAQFISWELLDAADKLWDEAERLATDETELARVRRSRLSVRFARARKMDVKDPDRSAYMEALIQDIRNFGIEYIRESQKLEKSFDVLRRNGDFWTL